MPREARFNQRDYTHYVIVSKGGVPFIESGWSYPEDARENIEGNLPDGVKAKVITKMGLKRSGVDPDDNKNWLRGLWWEAGGFDGVGEGVSRLYHVVAINERTGGKEYLTRTPMSHREANTMRSKFNPHRDVRVQLEEADGGGLDGVSPRTRQGTRVRFNAHPGSLVLYSHHPEIGEEGTVGTMPGFGKRTYLPGPGGGLLYVNWDESGMIGVSPNDVEKVGAGRGVGGIGGDEEVETVSLTYGVMPSKAAFVAHTEGNYPYPMELVGEEKDMILDLGINLNKNGIEEFDSKYSHKLGIRVLDAEAMYRFLTKLKQKHDSGETAEADVAGNLASAIMGTLGYEWV